MIKPSIIFICICCIYFLSWPGHLQSRDNAESVATAVSILEEQSLLIDNSYRENREGLPDIDIGGKSYSKYGIGLPILYLPFALITKILGYIAEEDTASHVMFSAIAPLFSLGLCVIYYLTSKALGAGKQMALLATVLFALFTISYKYAVYDGSENIQAFFLLTSFYFLIKKSPRSTLYSAMLLAFAILIKSVNLLFLPAYLLCLILKFKPFSRFTVINVITYAFLVVIACAIILALNYYRYGSFMEFGYGTEQAKFTFYNFCRNSLPLLFSFEMGFFIFSPILLIALFGFKTLFKAHPAASILVLYIFTTLFLLSAFFHEPKGAWAWGPRYMVPAVPFLMLTIPWVSLQSAFTRYAMTLLIILSSVASLISVAQKAQEYDVIRFNRNVVDASYYPPQMIGCAKLLIHKLTENNNRYPLNIFGIDKEGAVDTSDFETYRGLNFWYWHAANKFNLPILKATLVLYLLLYFGAVIWCIRMIPKL